MGRRVTDGTLVVLHGASSVVIFPTLEALPPWRGPVCLPTGLDHMLVRAQPVAPQPRTLVDRFRWSMRIVACRLTDGHVRLTVALHREVATVVRARHHVVVETALMDQRVARCRRLFRPPDELFVGMMSPLNVSEPVGSRAWGQDTRRG